jgi:hypothetical protein
MADYIPAKDADFDPWFKNLCEYVTQKTTMGPLPWTHVPPDEVTKLNNAYATWHTAYEATLKPHSPVETAAKNTARADAEADRGKRVYFALRWESITNRKGPWSEVYFAVIP